MPSGIRQCLDDCSHFINRIAEWITTGFSVVFTVVTIMQVITRYVLESSLPWPEEVARYSLVWVSFVAASILIKESEHVAVLFFREKVSRERTRHLLVAVVYLLMLGFVTILTVFGTVQCIHVMEQRWASVPSLSMFWVYLACPVGGAFMAVQTFKVLVDETMLCLSGSE